MTHAIYGIGRLGDAVRIGLNNSKKLVEWTRGPDGKWTASETGVEAIGYYGQIAGYDTHPKTGLGGFVATTAAKKPAH